MSSSPVIIITGASSGIGAATARLFADEGYRVVFAARRMERLESLVAEILYDRAAQRTYHQHGLHRQPDRTAAL